MKPISQAAMAEATRLTTAGRLDEAMALLQGTLSGAPAAASAADAEPQQPASAARPFIDLVPPSPATGASWTSPFQAAADGSSAAATSRTFPGLHPRNRAAAGRVAALPAGARFDQVAFANAAGRRDYKLYVPSSLSGEPMPLVMMLHGCTQSPDDFAAGTRMNLLAEEFGFLVAYPAQPKSSNASKCWNWFRPGDQRRGQGEPAVIAGIAQQIAQDHPIARAQIYVAGLSAGGAAAAIMGAAYPDLFAAVGVHSGLACGAASDVPSAFNAMRQGGALGGPSRQSGVARPVPTIVFHGDRDNTVSPVNGDQVIAQAKAGADLTRRVERGQSPGGIAYTRVSETDPDGRTVLEHWTLHGCGHAWSGGSTDGSYTEPHGPDASREMIRFFLRHRSS